MGFQINIKDIIDILFVTAILYGTYRLLRRSGAKNLFWGIFAFIVVWFLVSYVFSLELTGAVFDHVISVGVIALFIIFQDEIRLFVAHIGSKVNKMKIFQLGQHQKKQFESEQNIMQIVLACKNMSASHTGALIIFTRSNQLLEYAQTGERLDAHISSRLIEQIFYKNTPLHDGAMIITDGRIRAAACILPVSQDMNIPKHYGLRHRAALGMAGKSDALAVVISEETGNISIADGDTIRQVSPDELEHELTALNQ